MAGDKVCASLPGFRSRCKVTRYDALVDEELRISARNSSPLKCSGFQGQSYVSHLIEFSSYHLSRRCL